MVRGLSPCRCRCTRSVGPRDTRGSSRTRARGRLRILIRTSRSFRRLHGCTFLQRRWLTSHKMQMVIDRDRHLGSRGRGRFSSRKSVMLSGTGVVQFVSKTQT